MHVCLTCIEFFGYGIHGGFGRSTRFIGRELARRGVKVTVVVPRRTPDHPDDCEVDGMTVHQYRPLRPWTAQAIYRSCRADVYHSQDSSFGTWLAMRAVPHATHLITFRDPLDGRDWRIETEFSGQPRFGWRLYRSYIDNPFVRAAVRRADDLYCAAEFLIPKVVAKYGLTRRPQFLPTPVAIPASCTKAQRPTVCFVGRWEGRKRPELFFELARAFPEVDFIAVGGTQDPARERALRAAYAQIPNLRMTGFLDQFSDGELGRIMAASWVLVNTSPREGLPNTFLEAAAHGCALLSHTDPDGFASRFGLCVAEGRLAEGLTQLLTADRWRACGERGRQHVSRVFAADRAIDAHLDSYRRALER